MNVSETTEDDNVSDSASNLEITCLQEYNDENEAVETRRRELGQIQQDLRMLMERLNDFIVGNPFSYNSEEVNSAGDHFESPRCVESPKQKKDMQNDIIAESSTELFSEILATEIDKHLKDMQEIQNLSVLTNVLMNRIRKVTHLDTDNHADRIKLSEAAMENEVIECVVEQNDDETIL